MYCTHCVCQMGMGSVDIVYAMSNRHVPRVVTPWILHNLHTNLKLSGTFVIFIILLLSSDLPTVRQLLLKQTQLKCVMFGHLKDTKGVNDTVKVLKCCGSNNFICLFLKIPCQCLRTLCSVGGVCS